MSRTTVVTAYIAGLLGSALVILGAPLLSPASTPRSASVVRVEATGPPRIASLSMGFGHLAVITGSGQVYGFGDNNANQLSWTFGQSGRVREFQAIASLPAAVAATHTSAGASHTLVLGDDGRLYGVGLARIHRPAGDDSVG